jgi:RNA polymerase sigma factor (sigma-70 family)
MLGTVVPTLEQRASDGVLDATSASSFRTHLVYLARRRFRISADTAEDLVQAALTTYFEVRSRYPKSEEHLRILVGIFRNKCREHIERSIRATRGLTALKNHVRSGSAEPIATRIEGTMPGGVLGEMVHREEGCRILQALADLRPEAREMFRLISEGFSRKDLMRYYGLKANTLDSRLHAYRQELRKALSAKAKPR